MLTTGSSCAVSFTLVTFGTSTSSPNSMTCAVSIKMTSSTSTTPTRGTILISAMVGKPRDRRPFEDPPSENAMPLVLEGPFREIHELERKIIHPRAELPDRAAEQVVENVGGNGRGETERRGDERFRDAWGHGAEARAPRIGQRRKRVHDAPDRSEQPDERRNAGGCGQQAHVALQLRDLLADAELQVALQRQLVRHRPARFHLAVHLAITEIEYADQRRGAELLARNRHRLQPPGLTKRAQEGPVGRPRPAESIPLRKDHGPGEQRKNRDDRDHHLGHQVRSLDHLPETQL